MAADAEHTNHRPPKAHGRDAIDATIDPVQGEFPGVRFFILAGLVDVY